MMMLCPCCADVASTAHWQTLKRARRRCCHVLQIAQAAEVSHDKSAHHGCFQPAAVRMQQHATHNAVLHNFATHYKVCKQHKQDAITHHGRFENLPLSLCRNTRPLTCLNHPGGGTVGTGSQPYTSLCTPPTRYLTACTKPALPTRGEPRVTQRTSASGHLNADHLHDRVRVPSLICKQVAARGVFARGHLEAEDLHITS